MKRFPLLLCAVILFAGLADLHAQLFLFRTVRNLNDSGPESLRQTILDSNPNDRIIFAPSLNGGTIQLTASEGELLIGKTLHIIGLGAANLTVRGPGGSHAGVRRIFNVAPGVAATISGLTIMNGAVFGDDGSIGGTGSAGHDASGGAILNRGTLYLNNCIVRENTVWGGDGGYDENALYAAGHSSGGAIVNLGTLNLMGCTFASNRARGGVGAGASSSSALPGGNAIGGGIESQGVLNVVNCTFQDNECIGGVGGFTNAPDEPAGHSAGPGGIGKGGAIFSHPDASLNLTNTTFSNNSVTGGQGGEARSPGFRVYAGHGGEGRGGAIESHAPVSMKSCTLTGNIARGGAGGARTDFGEPGDGGHANGGGIANYNFLELTACTLAANSAFGGDGYQNGSDGYAQGGNLFQGGTANVYNSIFANGVSNGEGPDVDGSVTSQGHNLIRNTAGSSGFGAAGDYLNFDPQLGPLQDNGGLTFTMALLASSPALDAGDDALLNVVAADQRGSPRRTGAHVDIGAYEAGTTPVVNNGNSGPGSLRNAIAVAPSTDTIVFASSVTGPITLTSGEINIASDRNIVGPSSGVMVSGNNLSRIFNVSSTATVSISNLTISNGRVAGNPGASAFGGGVRNSGTLTLRNCTLQNNSVIGGNTSGSIAGVGGGGGAANFGNLTLINCTLAGNSAAGGNGALPGAGVGGGLANEGVLTVESCTVGGNSAIAGSVGTARGGGLYHNNSGGSTSIRNTIVANNSASGLSSNGPDVSGDFVSQGFNLVHNTSGSTGWSGTITGVDPLLAPLQNNGGPTFTMALLTGSPAIDQGDGGSVMTDQRGLFRPVNFGNIPNAGNGSDIGAYELQLSAVDIGLRAFDGGIIRIACEPAGTLTSPMRIHKNGTTYGILLVNVDSPDASRLRVQTSSGVKALQKLP